MSRRHRPMPTPLKILARDARRMLVHAGTSLRFLEDAKLHETHVLPPGDLIAPAVWRRSHAHSLFWMRLAMPLIRVLARMIHRITDDHDFIERGTQPFDCVIYTSVTTYVDFEGIHLA